VFAAADVVVAWQIWRLGELRGLPAQRCWWSAVLWLYNPFTATISTRGSCDSLVTALLLAVLLGLLRGTLLQPALLYGLAVHLRIYPIVYAPAIVLFLAAQQLAAAQAPQHKQPQRPGRQAAGTQPPQPAGGAAAAALSCVRGLRRWSPAVLQQGLLFGGLSGGVFAALGAGCYRLYGWQFVHEAFLHHLGRKDPRHNFSLHYYPIYLSYMPWGGAAGGAAAAAAAAPPAHAGGAAGPVLASLARALAALPPVDVARWASAPQAVLLLVLAGALHARLPLCWLLQTWAFVALNKVSTAQYFVWFFSLLPCALQDVRWPLPRSLLAAGAAWVAAQLHWLLWGYLLEFQGRGVHLALWGAGAAFLAANAACMCALAQCCGGAGGSSGAADGRGGGGRSRGRARAPEAGTVGGSSSSSRSASSRGRSRSRGRVGARAVESAHGADTRVGADQQPGRRSSRLAAKEL
jgi:phosphatidylinositol glycan class M